MLLEELGQTSTESMKIVEVASGCRRPADVAAHRLLFSSGQGTTHKGKLCVYSEGGVEGKGVRLRELAEAPKHSVDIALVEQHESDGVGIGKKLAGELCGWVRRGGLVCFFGSSPTLPCESCVQRELMEPLEKVEIGRAVRVVPAPS